MGLGLYNLTRYNTPDDVTQRWPISYDCYTAFTAAFDFGSLYTPAYFAAAELSAEMPLGWGYDYAEDFETALDAVCYGGVVNSPRYRLSSALSAVANCSVRISKAFAVSAELSAKITCTYGLYPVIAAEAELDAKANARIAIFPSYGLLDMLDAAFNAKSVKATQMVLDIVIPPGGKLVIDSDNYTVYLNNQDAIYAYSGEWIKFTRKLQEIEVMSWTSGNLDVSVLYQERYL